MFLDPVHEFLCTILLVNDFVDFLLKKICFVFLTIILNFFQSSKHLDCQYELRSLWQSSSYHALEYLVIFTFLKYLCQVLLILMASIWIMLLRALMLWIEDISMLLIVFTSFSMKWFSSLLFLTRDYFFVCMCSSNIEILMVMGVWSEINL